MHGVDLRDRAAYLRGAGALVVADLHVGRGEASAVEFPLGEGGDLRDRLADLLAQFEPSEVVFAGDVLHSFDGPTRRAASTLDRLVACCENAGADPTFVAGNHDVHLADARDGPVHDSYRAGDVLVAHGHERPCPEDRAAVDRYVVGHDHPTIDVEGDRRPCYLSGPAWDGTDLLMLPAFNRLAPGVAVNGMRAADFDSPLVADAGALRPLVYDDDGGELLSFPPLGEFRDLL